MKKVCPNCTISLAKDQSVELVYASEEKWYHITSEPIEYYYRCKNCGVSLNRKGQLLSLIPTYLVMFFLLLGKGYIFPKEMIWHIGIPATIVAFCISILVSKFVVRYEKRN